METALFMAKQSRSLSGNAHIKQIISAVRYDIDRIYRKGMV